VYPSEISTHLDWPIGLLPKGLNMLTTAFTRRLQSELCSLVTLDADTYFSEPAKYLPGTGSRINPQYLQMRQRRRRIEQLRQQLHESTSAGSWSSVGRSRERLAA
jgi:hypothetical protein